MSPTADVIAAVRDRDLRTAEELLRAGADPDAVDGDGTTLLGRAAANADTPMVALLLAGGADPDRRSRGGATALMLAADAGAIGAVLELLGRSSRTYLRDERGRSALDLARAWLGVDPEAELRRRLGAAPTDAVTVEREAADDEGLGSSETIRMLAPRGRMEIRTGHAAVATELERALGVRVPFGELMARALAHDDPDHVGRWFPAMALAAREDAETFALAAEASAAPSRPRSGRSRPPTTPPRSRPCSPSAGTGTRTSGGWECSRSATPGRTPPPSARHWPKDWTIATPGSWSRRHAHSASAATAGQTSRSCAPSSTRRKTGTPNCPRPGTS